MKISIALLFVAALITGCSIERTDTDFRAVTATQVGVRPQDVQILSSEGGKYDPFTTSFTGHVQGFKWHAQTPKGKFSCEGDVNLQRVICDKTS